MSKLALTVLLVQCMLVTVTLANAGNKKAKSLQDDTVTGKVTDSETGETLPGVNVMIQGTTQGSITDMDGNFTLVAPRMLP